jgi:hypothetical protein
LRHVKKHGPEGGEAKKHTHNNHDNVELLEVVLATEPRKNGLCGSVHALDDAAHVGDVCRRRHLRRCEHALARRVVRSTKLRPE